MLINFNHTHSGPVVPDYMPYEEPCAAGDPDASRRGHARGKLEVACREAIANLQPARFAVGWGECRGNINRRERMPDGTVLLGENPDGPCDPTVGVIRVDKLDCAPLAVAFRYSCHTVTLGPKTNLISPDYAGEARRVIESSLGCPSLFLQGCAGDLNPATGIGQDADTSPHARGQESPRADGRR